jgi:hypothetical protein
MYFCYFSFIFLFPPQACVIGGKCELVAAYFVLYPSVGRLNPNSSKGLTQGRPCEPVKHLGRLGDFF